MKKSLQFWVVKCASCSIFQVQQVKTKLTSKFKCKVCQVSTSLECSIYFIGKASECRLKSQTFSIQLAQGESIPPLDRLTLKKSILELKENDDQCSSSSPSSSNPIHSTALNFSSSNVVKPSKTGLCRPSELTSTYLQTGRIPPPSSSSNTSSSNTSMTTSLTPCTTHNITSTTTTTATSLHDFFSPQPSSSLSTTKTLPPPPTTTITAFTTNSKKISRAIREESKPKNLSPPTITTTNTTSTTSKNTLSSNFVSQLSKKLKLDLSKVGSNPFLPIPPSSSLSSLEKKN